MLDYVVVIRDDARLMGVYAYVDEGVYRQLGQDTIVFLPDERFFFSSRRRHTRCLSDWSSDVCSSDLADRACGMARQPPSAGQRVSVSTRGRTAPGLRRMARRRGDSAAGVEGGRGGIAPPRHWLRSPAAPGLRSEERRVGEAGRYGRWA